MREKESIELKLEERNSSEVPKREEAVLQITTMLGGIGPALQ